MIYTTEHLGRKRRVLVFPWLYGKFPRCSRVEFFNSFSAVVNSFVGFPFLLRPRVWIWAGPLRY